MKKISVLLGVLLISLSIGCSSTSSSDPGKNGGNNNEEIIYHIFVRSFFDTNYDRNGDIDGIREKLDYLEDLGVTSILLTPIVESAYYHNYFADNFKKIDSTYGDFNDWKRLVEAIHKKGMKIYLDQEFQYATLKQEWFKGSYKKPESEYSDYILYNDSLNRKPEPIVYDLDTLKGYKNVKRKVATVNLKNENVRDYFYNLLKFWADPNEDGSLDAGVDGFRLDHMMDNLDNKDVLTDLFKEFWCPLINRIKKINPNLKFIAEQADWMDYGESYINDACVDKVFAFNVRGGVLSFDKSVLSAVADTTFKQYSGKDEQITFIENHDVNRFASEVNQSPGKLRVGAALNFFIPGTPEIYYGQELGMTGKGGGFGDFNDSDAKDIPRRLAFKWASQVNHKGIASWYRDSDANWDSLYSDNNTVLSLKEQQGDTSSLWNFYKKIIKFYKSNKVLTIGDYSEIENTNANIYTFLRYSKQDSVLVGVNLSDQKQDFSIDQAENLWDEDGANSAPRSVWNKHKLRGRAKDSLYGDLPPYGIEVWRE